MHSIEDIVPDFLEIRFSKLGLTFYRKFKSDWLVFEKFEISANHIRGENKARICYQQAKADMKAEGRK